MTQRQRDKHIADRAAAAAVPATYPIASSLVGAEPTPDELGTWEGGRLELKGANNWVALKSRPTRTGDSKHAPSLDYASKINATHQRDYVAPLKIEESDNIPCDDSTAA